MQVVNTMALKITEDNYPVVVACLGGGVIGTPIKDLVGQYLVINELGMGGMRSTRRFGYSPLPSLSRTEDASPTTIFLRNRLFTADQFALIYKFDGAERKTLFTPVTKIMDEFVANRELYHEQHGADAPEGMED